MAVRAMAAGFDLTNATPLRKSRRTGDGADDAHVLRVAAVTPAGTLLAALEAALAAAAHNIIQHNGQRALAKVGAALGDAATGVAQHAAHHIGGVAVVDERVVAHLQTCKPEKDVGSCQQC